MGRSIGLGRSMARRLGGGVLAVLVGVPGTALADQRRLDPPLLVKPALFAFDLTWSVVSLLAAPAADAAPAPEPQPLISFADRRHRLFSLAPAAPGLQVSLDPDSEELLVGWQFEF